MSPLPFWQQCVIIALCSLASMLSRSLPFLLFKPGASLPSYIRYLGKALPSAVFALLVVYCLKDVSLLSGNHGIPEAIALLVTTLLHLWKRQMMLSMAAGTILYMGLVQYVFPCRGLRLPHGHRPMYLGVSLFPMSCKKRLDPFESRRFHFGDRYGIRTHTLCAENAAS